MDAIIAELRKTIGLNAASIGVATVERAIQQRIIATQTGSPSGYYHFITDNPVELRALIDALVVPETWFFRDRGAFAAVAAAAAASAKPEPLRYLCVPCATGEEPLSLAMSLLDAGIPPNHFHIDAFDICERLVAYAERGVYGRNSFRGNDSNFRARYFHETTEGCSIDPAVRRQATFRQSNLLDDGAFHGARIYDAIFCRNLLIYFDAEAQTKAVRKISRLLRDGGLLCVAPAETGLLLRHGFSPIDVPHSFAFKNEKKAAPPKVRIPPALRQPLPAARQPPVQLKPRPAPTPKATEPNPPLLSFADATRLANEGRFEEVSAICRAHIEAQGPSADAYCLLALVSDASARYEEAAIFYRKALYLDPEHHDALAHFSLLADKLGQTTAADALRRRARRFDSHAA